MRSPMRAPRVLLALVALALPAALLVAPSSSAEPAPARGGPGTWTKISTGGVTNTTEPGLYRTGDGVLHVVYRRQNFSDADIAFATISSSGVLGTTGNAVSGWDSLTSDPKLVEAAGGGMRLVFAGIRTTAPGDPYHTGQMFSATSDAAGTSWTLQSGALTKSGYAVDSYGTGATATAGGTPVVAFPLNDVVTWNVGGSILDTTFDFGDCCAYQATLARDGGDIWASFAGNGSDAAHAGLFVKRLLPTETAVTKVPQSSEGKDTLTPLQSTALVGRPGGGTYLAYCIGYPSCDKVGLWKVGSAAPKTVPGSAGARDIAISTGPGGRIWIAWTTYTDVKVVHTSETGTTFGAVRTIKPPKGADLYGVSVAGSNGSADVVINTGSALYHQQVLRGLSVKASPSAWKHGSKQKVTFTVTDAGDPVKGAKVSGGGESCTTAASGSCSVTYPSSGKKKVTVTATRAGYGAGKVVLRVT